MNDDKIKFSIRLGRPAYNAAKARAAAEGKAFTLVVADAATETLLDTHRSDREAEILRAVERVFFKLQKVEKHQHLDLLILKEMLALGVQAYFDHTPDIPASLRSAALLSGETRFHHYLDTLAHNVRQNKSILDEGASFSSRQDEIDGAFPGKPSNFATETVEPLPYSPQHNGKALADTPPSPATDNAASPLLNRFQPATTRRPGAAADMAGLAPVAPTRDSDCLQHFINKPSRQGE